MARTFLEDGMPLLVDRCKKANVPIAAIFIDLDNQVAYDITFFLNVVMVPELVAHAVALTARRPPSGVRVQHPGRRQGSYMASYFSSFFGSAPAEAPSADEEARQREARRRKAAAEARKKREEAQAGGDEDIAGFSVGGKQGGARQAAGARTSASGAKIVSSRSVKEDANGLSAITEEGGVARAAPAKAWGVATADPEEMARLAARAQAAQEQAQARCAPRHSRPSYALRFGLWARATSNTHHSTARIVPALRVNIRQNTKAVRPFDRVWQGPLLALGNCKLRPDS